MNIANLPLTYGDTESSLGPVYIIERNELGSRDLAKLQVCSFLQLIVSSVLGISKRVKRWQISDSDYYVLVEGYKTFKLLNTFDLRTSSKFSWSMKLCKHEMEINMFLLFMIACSKAGCLFVYIIHVAMISMVCFLKMGFPLRLGLKFYLNCKIGSSWLIKISRSSESVYQFISFFRYSII